MRKLDVLLEKNEFLNSDELTKKIMGLVLSIGDEAVDIGVNYGQFLTYLSMLVGAYGKVIGFEPIEDLYELNLQKIHEKNIQNIFLNNYALSDFEGVSEFTVFNEAKGYSGLKENIIPNPMFDVNNTSKIEVLVKKLDSFIKKFKNLKLIKIDVEGAELLVLKGAEQLLVEYKPVIVFEFGMRTARSFHYNQKDIYDFFILYGYSIYLMCGLKLNTYEEFLAADKFIYNFLAIHDTDYEAIQSVSSYCINYISSLEKNSN